MPAQGPPSRLDVASPTPTEKEEHVPPQLPSPSKIREPHIKLANVREKLRLLRSGKARAANMGIDMADVIEEAQLNRSAVLNSLGAAAELIHNLSVPPASRRAVHLREITELGRHIRLPAFWFSSERKQAITWYHVLQNLKLVQYNAGDVVFEEGLPATHAYWFLGDKQTNSAFKLSAEVEEANPKALVSPEAQRLATVAHSRTKRNVSAAPMPISIWQGVGFEALAPVQKNYASTVVAVAKGSAAVLSRQDYAAISAMLQNTTFDSLKGTSLMLKAKQERTQAELKELAALLSVCDLFNTMEDDFRVEAAGLVEYMYCPEDFTLFEEGDKVDFNYVILQGSVALSKMDEDVEVKTTGQQFGSMIQLVNGKKKRPFSAVSTTPCELAIMSRIAYNRIVKKQLQDVIFARTDLLKGLANLEEDSSALQRIASFCADESFPAGSTIIDPANFPYKVYFIMQGEAKEVWDPDDPSNLPTYIDSIEKVVPLRQYRPQRKTFYIKSKDRKKKTTGQAAALGVEATSTGISGLRLTQGLRRHAVEVAKLGKGDVINGLSLLGKGPQFHVIAHTKVKVLSFDCESSDITFGSQLFPKICKLVQAKHNWCRERLIQNLAVQKYAGINKAQAHEAASLATRLSAPALFLDHYIPQDAFETEAEAAAPATPAPPLTVNKAAAQGGSVNAPTDSAPAEATASALLPSDISSIRSTVVRGKDPPPLPPSMPWYSTCCPPHFAKFRDTVTAAAAQVAAASNSMMHASTTEGVGRHPFFMQELLGTKEDPRLAHEKQHEVAWTGRPPSSWGTDPQFAGQVCTTVLDMDTSRTLRSIYTRFKPVSRGTGTSRRARTPPQGMDAITSFLFPSATSTDRRQAPGSQGNTGRASSTASAHAQTGLADTQTGLAAQQAEGRSSSRLSSRSGVDRVDADLAEQGAGRASRSVSLPGVQGAAATPGHVLPTVAEQGCRQFCGREGGLAQSLSWGDWRAGGDVRCLAGGRAADLSRSWAAGMAVDGGQGWEAGRQHSHPMHPMHSSTQWAGGGGGTQSTKAAGDLLQTGVPDWVKNRGSLPRLPNSPCPVLISDNLKQQMLRQPTTSHATAEYARKRTSTLVSQEVDDDDQLPLQQPPTHAHALRHSMSGPQQAAAPTLRSSATAAITTHPQDRHAGGPSSPPLSHAQTNKEPGMSSPVSSPRNRPSRPSQSSPVPPLNLGPLGARQACFPHSHETPGEAAQAPASATSSFQSLRSRAALGATLLRPPPLPDSSAMRGAGMSDQGTRGAGVIILPHMMSMYDGILVNDRGFLKHEDKRTSPRRRRRGRQQPQSTKLPARQSSHSIEAQHGEEGEGDEQPQEPPSSLCSMSQRQSCPTWGALRPSGTSFGPSKSQMSPPSRHEHLSPRGDEPVLPLDRDAGAPSLKDHYLSDPTLEDIRYILNRWGTRWHEERVQAFHRYHQHEAHIEGVPLPASVQERGGGLQGNTGRAQEDQPLQLETFGTPCLAPSSRIRLAQGSSTPEEN